MGRAPRFAVLVGHDRLERGGGISRRLFYVLATVLYAQVLYILAGTHDRPLLNNCEESRMCLNFKQSLCRLAEPRPLSRAPPAESPFKATHLSQAY